MKPLTPDDIDRELQQLLTVEPSPNFVARVRSTVENRPTHAGVRGIFIAFAASVTAVLLIAVAVNFTRPTLDETTASPPQRPQEVDRTPVPDAVSASPQAEAAPTTVVRAGVTRAQGVPSEPWLQVMLSPDDRQAIERLVRSTQDGTPVLSFDETNHKLTIADLTIAPITTEPLAIAEQQGVVQ